MIQSFTPQDIAGLNRLSGILAIPFFAAAVYIDFGLWVLADADLLQSMASSSFDPVVAVSKTVAFILGVVFVAPAYIGAKMILALHEAAEFFIGFSLLSFGVLGLGVFLPGASSEGVNTFWHLGALCWGLEILGPGEIEQKP
ncbi:hypothetical protein [Marinobacter bohaiensis]|uniref:hypothetical protein n=1 Tax=Marinobacter bohaiensis TaxID=2201898 RepID=UPI000DADB5D1|nr:hypothetical protein [Marinobacter bohaiensis]